MERISAICRKEAIAIDGLADGRSLSREVVGQRARRLAQAAGIRIPASTRVLLIFGDSSSGEGPVAGADAYGDEFGRTQPERANAWRFYAAIASGTQPADRGATY